MESDIKRFAGKCVRYREYGAGAEIVELNNALVADFPNHIDAETFMELLSTKVYLVIEEMKCDYGDSTVIAYVCLTKEKADAKAAELRKERDSNPRLYKYPTDWFVEEHEIDE